MGQWVYRYQRKIAKSYGEQVRYFHSKKTYSLGKARNLCMAKSKAEYIAFLDCDDLWLPQKLEKQIPLFEKDPEVALVFSDAIYFNESGNLCQIYQKFKPPRGKIFKELFRKYFICMASTVIQRSAIKNIDWFDERMKLYEDACFFLRLAYKFKTDYCDEPLVKYRVRPDSGAIVDFGNLPYERDLALKTFTDDFPSFEKEHKQDIKIFQSKTNAQRAINEWNNNNPKNARKILRNTNYKSLLIYALFFVTFLPTTTFKTFFILNYKIKSWFNWYNFE